jgi:hypothetical protein
MTDPAGVITHRPGAMERIALLLDDWRETHRRLLDTETRMTAIPDGRAAWRPPEPAISTGGRARTACH